jgi:hypothetical protein
MRYMVWILLMLGCTRLGLAQHSNCADVQIFESKLPIYPPIARAAHLHGIFHFMVDVYPDGHSDVRLLDGPSKGVNQVFVASAREFIESRRYGWTTGGEHSACSYTAEIKYRILPEEVVAPTTSCASQTVILATRLLKSKRQSPSTCIERLCSGCVTGNTEARRGQANADCSL